MAANSQSDKIAEIHPECGKNSTQAQLSSSIVDEKSSNKAIQKNKKYFLFDIIVATLDIPNVTIEQPAKLLVTANFIGKNLKISSDRINVLDFTTESILEFAANPSELRQQLSINPLSLKVNDTKKILGYGILKWPTEFLSSLEESGAGITDSFEVELKKCDGTRTGSMRIIVRLQPKCEEYEEDNTLDGKCRNAHKEIDPNDVLFLVGVEAKKSCCCSQVGIIPASDSDHDLRPKCLDLSSYRAVNSQNVYNTNILAAQDPICQDVEVTSNHYQKILQALRSKTRENSSDGQRNLFSTLPSESCLQLNVLPSSDNLCREHELFPPDNGAFAAKTNVKQITCAGSSPKLVEHEPQLFRYCPLCKENMQYLPKLATCPNCCYKPVPCFEEKLYDDSQNADQILKEFQNNLQQTDKLVTDDSAKHSSKCRCTCKYEPKKPCANCRIRKLCKDIFQTPLTTNNDNDKCEQESSVVNCVSSSDNRPFLTKIFSELKDLYDIEEPKKKEIDLDERCEKRLNKHRSNRKPLPVEKKSKKNVQTVQNDDPNATVKPDAVRKRKKCSAKAVSAKAVKSKLYDYQFARQIFTYKCGHKAGVKSTTGEKNVPPNMGWLWNIHNRGKWKPGAIRKPIKELMRYFLKDFPADTLLVSPYSYHKKYKSKGDHSYNTLLQKPTLHVYKKNGEYNIIMRPLKPVEVLKVSADPYENMKPIQFRIVKNPQVEIIRSIKNCLKSLGFKKCICHRPITYCYCRSFVDKKRLEYQCRKECSNRQIKSCCDTLILTDTSESEDEFDFAVTPPVGLIKPEKLVQINLVNVSTQYNELDWNPVPLFPRPPNKYMQMYQCAVRERKAGALSARNDNSVAKDNYNPLRKDACPKRTFGKSIEAASKRPIVGKYFTGARGEGDGLLMGKIPAKRSPVASDIKGKYGDRGDPASKNQPENDANFQKKKVNMLAYIKKRDKKLAKITPQEAALKRKEKINLLKGANPPLLCMVDRLGKPIDPCAPCFPCGDDRVC